MRKAILFLLVAAALTFAGCSQNATKPADGTKNTPAPTADAENTDATDASADDTEGTAPDTTATKVPATPTARPTKTPRPTPTKRPTSTPIPTVTPKPTAVPVTPTPPIVTYERARSYTNNSPQPAPVNYLYDTTAEKGTVIELTYDTKNHLKEDGKVYQKSALVYLPPCYDEADTETKYNVLYLMHGGGDSPKWFLGGPGRSNKFTRMLDYMITTGEIEPMIVCAVSYYEEYNGDATKNCLDFHYELMNDVIPVLETTYPTHAKDVTPEGLAASRTHRAFGGFSMGAVTTWSVFEHCLDEFAYFMPMSGDCWALGATAGKSRSAQTAQHLADVVANSGKTAEDFIIYSGCGTSDSANPNLSPQIAAMNKLNDTFILCENFANGNLFQCVVPGGHDVNTVNQILQNGIPKLFH